MSKYSIIVILSLVIISLLLAYGYLTKPVQKIYVTRADTTFVDRIIAGETITVEGKAKIIYRHRIDTLNLHDTVYYTTPAFVAKLDTIVKDTFNIRYFFPENKYQFVMRERPDTIRTEYITLTKDSIIQRAWWEVPAYILGGLVVGYFINDLSK